MNERNGTCTEKDNQVPSSPNNIHREYVMTHLAIDALKRVIAANHPELRAKNDLRRNPVGFKLLKMRADKLLLSGNDAIMKDDCLLPLTRIKLYESRIGMKCFRSTKILESSCMT